MMMLYKIVLINFFIIATVTLETGEVEGDKNDNKYYGETAVNYNATYEEIYEMLDIDSLEKKINESSIGIDISITSIVDSIINQDTEYFKTLFLKGIEKILIGELSTNRTLMLQLVSIVLLGSIFVNMSGPFCKGFISENGFYVTYLIITSIILTSFLVSLELVTGSLEKILSLIRILVPVYAIAMNFVGHAATSAGMYQIILVGIWLVQVVILRFIIPMIKFYVIISLINNFNREDSFSKMSTLIKNLVEWMLKSIVIFTAGLNIIKSLIEPQIDALGRTTVNRVISAIPGGGVVSVLTGTFLGAGMVIKNSIGLAGIIILLLIVLVPVVKTFLIMLTVRITGVMIQPVGDKRYVEGVEALAKGMGLLLQTIGSSVVLFMLTIAIMSYATNNGG